MTFKERDFDGALGSPDIIKLEVSGNDLVDVRTRMTERGTSTSREEPPALVVADYASYNIVKWRGRFFAVSQQLGSVDLAALDQATLASFRSSHRVFVADEQADVKLMVDAVTIARLSAALYDREERLKRSQVDLAAAEKVRAELSDKLASSRIALAKATLENEAAIDRLSAEATAMTTWIKELQRRLVEAGKRRFRLFSPRER